MKRSLQSYHHVRIAVFLLSVYLWHDTTTTFTFTSALLLSPPPSVVPSAKSWVTTPPSLASSLAASTSSSSSSAAFVIERLSAHAPPRVFSDVAKMCINVFFNHGRGPGAYYYNPPWQQAQLTYLQHMQAADLQQRRYSQQKFLQQQQQEVEEEEEYVQEEDFALWYPELYSGSSGDKKLAAMQQVRRQQLKQQQQQQQQQNDAVEYNEMFVAYQVIRAEPHVAQRKPLLLDLSQVVQQHGAPSSFPVDQIYHDDEDVEYVRGELLGFCEVTERYLGLDMHHHLHHHSMYYQQQQTPMILPSLYTAQVRPVLTNLAVKPKARQLGIGSALVQACEDAVRQRGRFSELVLEVEADNTAAMNFYQKRGYQILYQDPACRRYNVDGWWLRKVPCTRVVMRKSVYQQAVEHEGYEETSSSSAHRSSRAATTTDSTGMTAGFMSMLQRLRDKSLSYIHV
jgi:ribosomal protein S18 acetylase RimI-like enzyme